jgi:hypothetical protein
MGTGTSGRQGQRRLRTPYSQARGKLNITNRFYCGIGL